VLWTDSKYTQKFFGVTEAQAAIADISPYSVKSGIDTVRFGVGADYVLTQHWMLGAHVTYGKLQGDAADSPVTTDKTQRMLAAFAMYRF
jgi:outer membrane protein